MKIFWSWQDDLDNRTSRQFIRDCLFEAISQLNKEIEIGDSERELRLDHDTRGVLGSPPIAETILKKIDESFLFVGDVTPVASIEDTDGKIVKKIMNPNVAIEMGYATGKLGHEKIITIMNSAFGKTPDDLPFNIKHKRGPIEFKLGEGASKEDLGSERRKLVSALKEIIGEHIKAHGQITATQEKTKLRTNFDLNGQGVFFDYSHPLLRLSTDGWGTNKDREIKMTRSNSYIYTRLTPQRHYNLPKSTLRDLLFSKNTFNVSLLFGSPNQWAEANKFGSIVARFQNDLMSDFVQMFQDGSIVSFSNSLPKYNGIALPLVSLRRLLTENLLKNLKILEGLEGSDPKDQIYLEIGLISTEKVNLVRPDPIDPNYRYIDNVIGPLEETTFVESATIKVSDIEKINELIKNFIIRLVDDTGQRFDYDAHRWK